MDHTKIYKKSRALKKMINPKEARVIVASTIVLAAVVGFFKSLDTFLYTLLAVFLVLAINIIAKKITSFYLESEIEMRFWEIGRWGFKPRQKFGRPFPAWIFFPILSSAITLGHFVWMSIMVFDVKPKSYRAAKRHGLYSFSEMTEDHIGFIAAAGVVANLVFAFLGYLIGFSEFTRLNLYMAFFSMLPFSDMDGNKIFFGSLILWSFLAVVTVIGLGYALFLI